MTIHLGIPQIILIAFTAVGVLSAVHNHGSLSKTNFWHHLLGVGITYCILIWGGFFG